MKRFEITVEGYIAPRGNTYEIEAANKKQAKKKALEMFMKEFEERKFNWVKIIRAWEMKERAK